MALKGIRVLEMAGLAPAPFCGMILADFGASVIRVDRANGAMEPDRLARGKRSIAINLKDPKGQEIVQKMSANVDVLIEPFRPGVMEKLNLGPEKLLAQNPRLIYARLSGYGQSGPYMKRAGHDINYVATSGVLSILGTKEKPLPPINLLADFAGGGLTCAFGILMSLYERQNSGKGQVVDANMVEGAAYVSSFLFRSRDFTPIFGNPRAQNWLDGGAHFYDTYRTKDEKFMAVGSLEPQFYSKLMEGLQLDIDQLSDFETGKELISKQFASKTQREWTEIFDKLDACVTPILEMEEAPLNVHNAARKSFVKNPHTNYWEPEPAPRLSRTPGKALLSNPDPIIGQHTLDILREFGYDTKTMQELQHSGVVEATTPSKI